MISVTKTDGIIIIIAMFITSVYALLPKKFDNILGIPKTILVTTKKDRMNIAGI